MRLIQPHTLNCICHSQCPFQNDIIWELSLQLRILMAICILSIYALSATCYVEKSLGNRNGNGPIEVCIGCPFSYERSEIGII